MSLEYTARSFLSSTSRNRDAVSFLPVMRLNHVLHFADGLLPRHVLFQVESKHSLHGPEVVDHLKQLDLILPCFEYSEHVVILGQVEVKRIHILDFAESLLLSRSDLVHLSLRLV